MRNISLYSIFNLCLLLTVFMTAGHQALAQTPNPMTHPVEVDVLGTCVPDGSSGGGGTPVSTKFFVKYSQQPDSVYWLFEKVPLTEDSLFSRQLQPVHTFSGEGTFGVRLHAVYGEDTVIYDPFPVTIETTDSQLQIKEDGKDEPVQEVVLCDVPKTLTASLAGGSGGGGGGGAGGGGGGDNPVMVTWYRPQSADEPNPIQNTEITVDPSNIDPVTGKHKDVGTYYVIYQDPNDPTACPIYSTFRVVIYEETDQNSSRWFFGNNAGIDFRTNTAITSNGALTGGNTAPEGNAMVGDFNADVLFMSNGETLWYGNDLELPATGNNMGGSRNVAQNSLFVGFPADETLYYLFTINENRRLSFSTVDLKSSPPIPGAALSEGGNNEGLPIKNIFLHEPVAEKLTSANRTGGGVWVIAHELGSNTFLSYPVTPEGIGFPVKSSVGSNMAATDAESTGYMQISEDGTVLATTVNNPKQIELFKFDADSGNITDPIQLPIAENGTLYGLGFAGNRLYATVKNPGGPSYLYQYTVDSTLDLTNILASKVTWTVNNEELGAVQLGPDGQIYIARNGKQQLFRIPNDSLSSDFPLTQNTFDLAAGTSSTLGLPNFGANAGASVPEPGVTAMGACIGDSIRVSGMQRYSNDETLIFELLNEAGQVLKTHPEAATGNGASTGFSADDYGNQTGTFSIRLTIKNECGTFVVPELATAIVSAKPEARLATDRLLEMCENQSVTFVGQAFFDGAEADPTTVNFVWIDALSNRVAGTEPELTVDRPGAWLFFVASGTGCTSDTLNVEALDLRPKVNLSSDISLCLESEGPKEIAVTVAPPDKLSDFNYKWSLSRDEGQSFEELSATGSSLPLTNLNTSLPGTYKYVVEATYKNPDAGNCFKADTLNISIVPPPEIEIVASNNNCNGSATLTAEVTGSDSENITYYWEGPAGTVVSTSPILNITQSGTYSVSIEDQESGCNVVSEPLEIDLKKPLGNISLKAKAGCSTEGMPAPSSISLKTSYTGSGLSIKWYNLNAPSEELAGTTNQKEILVTENGKYRAIVRVDNAGCDPNPQIDTAEVEVKQTIIPQRQLKTTYVICPSIPEMSRDTLVVEGFTSYEWRRAGSNTVLSIDSAFIVSQKGDYELRVNGCSDPVRFTVAEDCTPVLWVPNAIKIDGVNNTFRILNEKMLDNIQNFQILIMNRWGEVIWQSTDPYFEWKGTSRNGEQVMVNTYVYVITYRNMFGEDQNLKKQRGGITVLK